MPTPSSARSAVIRAASSRAANAARVAAATRRAGFAITRGRLRGLFQPQTRRNSARR